MSSEVRERIIYSAIELFANKGFHETKVDEIAELSGVAKGTVYLYFKSKEELLREALNFVFEKMLKNYEIDESKSFDENIYSVITKNIKFVGENIYFYKMMFSGMYRGIRSDFKNNGEFCFTSVINKVKYLLKKGIDEGFVRTDIDLDNLSILVSNIIFSSLMNVAIVRVLNKNLNFDEDKFKEDVYKFLLEGIRRKV
ncbi:MAG: TetR/AcrR family transcriptional regulator [Brevinematia bacterium]